MKNRTRWFLMTFCAVAMMIVSVNCFRLRGAVIATTFECQVICLLGDGTIEDGAVLTFEIDGENDAVIVCGDAIQDSATAECAGSATPDRCTCVAR